MGDVDLMGLLIGPLDERDVSPATPNNFVTLGGIYSLLGGRPRRKPTDPWVNFPWLKIGPYTGPDFSSFFWPQGRSDQAIAERDAVRNMQPSGTLLPVPSNATGISALPSAAGIVRPEGVSHEPDPRINEMTIVSPRRVTEVAPAVSAARLAPAGIESLAALPSNAIAVPPIQSASPLVTPLPTTQALQPSPAQEQPDPRINEMSIVSPARTANAPVVRPDMLTPEPSNAQAVAAQTPDSLQPTTDLTLPDVSYVRPEGPPGGFPAAANEPQAATTPDQASYDPQWEATKDWIWRHTTTAGRIREAADEAARNRLQPVIPGTGQFTADTQPEQPLIPGTGQYTAATTQPRSPEGTPEDLEKLWKKITTFFGGDDTAKPDEKKPDEKKPDEKKPDASGGEGTTAPPGITVNPDGTVTPVATTDGLSAADLQTYIENLKTLYPKLDLTNPAQERADRYAAQEAQRTQALAQLAMASGMIASAGKSWQPGATGVMNAAQVYGEGFQRYQNALQSAADRYARQQQAQQQYQVGITDAGVKMYQTAVTQQREDVRAARKQQVDNINEYFKAQMSVVQNAARAGNMTSEELQAAIDKINTNWQISLSKNQVINRYADASDATAAAAKS